MSTHISIKQRLLALLLTLAMLLSSLGGSFGGLRLVTAQAADMTAGEELSIGTGKITADQYYLYSNGALTTDGAGEDDYNLYYQSENQELVLNNISLNTTLYVPGNTTIIFKGTNSMNGSSGDFDGIQVQTDGDLIVKGEAGASVSFHQTGGGRYWINAQNANDVEVTGDLTVTGDYGGTIFAKNGSVKLSGNVVINVDDVTNTGSFTSDFISAEGDITICDNAKITAKASGNGLDASTGNVTIEGNSSVTITEADMAICVSQGDVLIGGNSIVTTSSTRCGIECFQGNVSIEEGATADITSASDTGAAIDIGASSSEDEECKLSVKGRLTVKSPIANIGLAAPQSILEIDGGIVNLSGGMMGITAQKSYGSRESCKIEIKNNSDVTISSTYYGIFLKGDTENESNINDSVNIENSSLKIDAGWVGIYNKDCNLSDLLLGNSTVEITTSSYYAFGKAPTLKYTPCRKITAGTDAVSAVEVSKSNLEDSTFYQKYVKIEPAEHDLDENNICTRCGEKFYTVELSAGDGGKASGGGTYAEGTKITITASPYEGYHFVKWSDGSTDASRTVEVLAAMKLTATFALDDTEPEPSTGDDTGDDASAAAESGDGAAVALVAAAAVALPVVMVTTVQATAPNIALIADVNKEMPYYSAIKYAVENQLIDADAVYFFRPGKSLTRSELALALYRLDGKPCVTGEATYADVTASFGSMNSYSAITWVQQNSLMEADADNTFRPKRVVTREEAAMALYRYATAKGWDVYTAADISGCPDAASVSAAALQAMQWAVGKGIFPVNADNTLAPQAELTRTEAAEMLYRLAMLAAE